MVAGVVPQGSEGGVHVQAEAFGEFAFGLVDDDPAVEGGLQLPAGGSGAAQVAFVEQADGCGVGQGLGDAHVGRVEGAWLVVEQVQTAEDLFAQPHGQGMHRDKTLCRAKTCFAAAELALRAR